MVNKRLAFGAQSKSVHMLNGACTLSKQEVLNA